MKSLLLAGCGGTGVEILKLIYNKYNITVIDKDIIELSNLNRLFPFSSKELGRYKAEVLAEKYNLNYIVGDILELKVLDYDIVLIAVDNIHTRMHLNYIYKMSPRGILVDCGVNTDMCHVFSINKEGFCLYCMREVYEIEIKEEKASCSTIINTDLVVIPSVCYINSICASLVLLILEDEEYNYYIYNGRGGIFLNKMNLKRDEYCILCNK